MQDRPTASELLAAIAALLEDELLAGSEGALKHRVRVAGNLCRILERESRLGGEQHAREAELLSEVLGEPVVAADVVDASAELARRLASSEDRELDARAWRALLEIVRGKLAVAKPGYDAYDFADEGAARGSHSSLGARSSKP